MAPFTSTEIRGLRILLADDEIFIREMGSDVLTMLGCKPTVAADGREAWEFFQKDPNGFDVS
jgi:CheY-like chemotaxis protein